MTNHFEEPPTGWDKLKRVVLGPPRDLADRSVFHRISLIPFLAWVGLGADGLSSSAYGPEEAFHALGQHAYLATFLALAVISTVIIISMAYSHIIEQFPMGGGGYVVASKLLGEKMGVVSGGALVVDYVLTITVSIAAAGSALFSMLPPELVGLKLPMEILLIFGLIALNIRGVKESVLILTPIFILFLITHAFLILGGIVLHMDSIPQTTASIVEGYRGGMSTLGLGGIFLLLVHAYSMGGGTYTGIEAVSNGLMMMREPKVATGKRTMFYMAASLSLTAAGLLVCYFLWKVTPVAGKTMNAVLVERLADETSLGWTLVVLTLLSEGALLIVAAQAGFLDGPRVLANMAVDSWVPRSFAAFSERLTTQNGIFLMGGAALAALLYTKGNVSHLVVMYSINVFLTFSISMLAMARHSYQRRKTVKHWKKEFLLFIVGLALCGTILVITIHEKFSVGGWITLVVTGTFIVICFAIRRHYRYVADLITTFYSKEDQIEPAKKPVPPLDPSQPTAALLVTSYGGLGIHILLKIFRTFPNHFKNLVFISVSVVDSGRFKGADELEALQKRTEEMLKQYVAFAARMGIPATYRTSMGTDTVAEAVELCEAVAQDFKKVTFFSAKIIFERDKWFQRILHNETAYSIQKRIQLKELTLVVLPARVMGH